MDGEYILQPKSSYENKTDYTLLEATLKSQSTIHTFDGAGESQYVSSTLKLKFLHERRTHPPTDDVKLITIPSLLQYDPAKILKTLQSEVDIAKNLINNLVDKIDKTKVDLNQIYDDTLSELFNLVKNLDGNELRELYKEFSMGTAYHQETAKNIFLEILPQIGTLSSIELITELVVKKQINPVNAIQLIISIPFTISEFNMEIVNLCKPFLSLENERSDVVNVAVLSFSTIVFKTFISNKMSQPQFDQYVKQFFDLFIKSQDYNQQILYIQALSNLQVGNVAQYLISIIQDPNMSVDLRYLAMWATMPTSHTRGELSYQLFWPIFENHLNPLELRIAAFTILLTSNPSPGRLLSLHRIITQNEGSDHLLNFYRTTVISMSDSTYPCHQSLYVSHISHIFFFYL